MKTVAIVVACLIGGVLIHSIAIAQGSAGGSIGKQGKSVSGGEDTERPAPRSGSGSVKRASKPAEAKQSRCPNIAGQWSSWASGMFGKGDTAFFPDGSASHKSGYNGKWFCANGQLRIEWSDGKPGAVRLSPDGKTIYNWEGGVHARRD